MKTAHLGAWKPGPRNERKVAYSFVKDFLTKLSFRYARSAQNSAWYLCGLRRPRAFVPPPLAPEEDVQDVSQLRCRNKSWPVPAA